MKTTAVNCPFCGAADGDAFWFSSGAGGCRRDIQFHYHSIEDRQIAANAVGDLSSDISVVQREDLDPKN